VSFGNFLIKQVVEELKREWPRLTNFVTLSPAPGFAGWLRREASDENSPAISSQARRALALLEKPNWPNKTAAREALQRALVPLAAHYFLHARTASGRIVDPVARFHLGNGARLERLNPFGDLSEAALRQSHGLMVNYLYDLDHIEENHEAYANKNEVVASSAVRKLARAKPREIFETAPDSGSAES
jgi:malonyl-CoA decarboxylase